MSVIFQRRNPTRFNAAASVGGENPDSLPTGTTLQQRVLTSVNVPNDGPINDAGADITQFTHQPTGSYSSSYGAYEISIAQDVNGVVGTEQQQGHGLKWWPLSQAAADAVQVFCLQYFLKFDQRYIDECMTNYDDATRQSEVPPDGGNPLGGYVWGGGKMLDYKGYDAAGTAADDNTRQVTTIVPVRGTVADFYSVSGTNVANGLYLSAQNGGAGGQLVYDGTNTPYSFAPYANTWHCINVYASCQAGNQFTAIWVKRQGGPTIAKSVRRTSSMSTGNDGTTYQYANRGWCWPALYNSFVWGYWQQVRNAHVPNPKVTIGGPITIATGWIPPPF